MGEAKQQTTLNRRLDDLAQDHAKRILVEVMHRRNYSGETLVQLVEALRRFERSSYATRQDVAERVKRDAKKRAERKKAASK